MATLLELVERLGPDLVTVTVAPLGLDVAVSQVVLHDPLAPTEPAVGALLLGIGLTPDVAACARLLQAAPAALVLQHDGAADPGLLALAAEQGVAVLLLPTGTSWVGVLDLAQVVLVDAAAVEGEATSPGELVQELFRVANAVASRIGAPVTIEDNSSRLLAYSAQDDHADEARAATILGHRVPDAYRAEVRRLGITRRLLTEVAPISFSPELPGISPRVVVALRARGQVLGSMWAIAAEPFHDARTAAFADAARTVSLRIWEHRVAADLQRGQRAQAMALVLAGGPAAAEVGRRCGLDSAGYRLLGVTVRGPAAQRRSAVERVRDVVGTQLSATGAAPLVADLGDVVYVVLPCSGTVSGSREQARDAAARVRAGLDADLRDEVVVGRSAHTASLVELGLAREEVQAVLRVLSRDEIGRRDAELEEVGLEVALHRLADLQAGRSSLRSPVLAAVTQHDDRHGTDYRQTLEAHLASFGDAVAAAARLNVHTNTFRYRLRRLGELFEVDLGDPDVRFALMLQLRLDAL